MEPIDPQSTDIAIIGMAGRLPNAHNLAEFWRNLCDGVECISRFSAGELEVADAAKLAQLPNYVKARGIMTGVEQFDAAFFGVYPKEAELIDPQHRIFLECCWHAFEDAGYDPLTYAGIAAVYAGCSPNTYFLRSVCADRGFIGNYTAGYQVGNLNAMLGANFEFLPTRVAYKLNLRGPAFSLNCGCSTSLVAVCQACLSLQNYQCDLALAGGVSITFPQKRGYLYEPGGMVSPDGHCRTFDAAAQGTVFGDGAGVVLLKRLTEALADRDHIYAVIKGFGLDNDGNAKVGFTAPAVEGQARAIAMAHASAGVDPESISYVEAHGTGTPLGDPVELAALTQAFRRQTQARQFCAIGTAKTSIGHLDVAAGVAGLIKTALSLQHKTLPPSLNFERPNPALNLETSPFYVNARLTPWTSTGGPLRAGVSAFGMGGTNAHVVLEEAPAVETSKPAREAQLIVLAARSAAALAASGASLAEYFEAKREVELADVAYTLMTGRHAFEVRKAVVARNPVEASAALRDSARGAVRRSSRSKPAEIVFMFPGQGAQYAGMARQLYAAFPQFRAQVDTCCAILEKVSALDLKRLLLHDAASATDGGDRIDDTQFAQPALFVVEYALACTWMELGIRPTAMIGHSVGEFVAACIAGVLSLEDALRLVAERGRMMQAQPGGAMVSVRLSADNLAEYLNGELCLATVNGPSLSVAAGPHEAIAELEGRFDKAKVIYRRLHTSHAFHSSMMEPVVGPFAELVKGVALQAPAIPFLSGVTGSWISDQEAVDAQYWARHLRSTVRFSEGVKYLRAADGILLEVGPGRTLATLARQHPAKNPEQLVVTSLGDSSEGEADVAAMLGALGQLWTNGAEVNWSALYEGEKRGRVSLPLYPFERAKFWLEPGPISAPMEQSGVASAPMATIVLTEAVEDRALVVNGKGSAHESGLDSARAVGHGAETNGMEATQANGRAGRIRSEVAAIFQDLSGLEVSGAGDSTSFLELGFDSLFLTQVSQALQSKFGIKITFRQLLDQLSTLEALVAYLDEKLPADALPAPAPVASEPARPPVVAPAAADDLAQDVGAALSQFASGDNPAAGSDLEALFKSQLQAMSELMNRQLDVLRRNATGAGRASDAKPVVADKTMTAAPTATAPLAIKPEPAIAVSAGSATGPQPRKFIPFRPVDHTVADTLSPLQTGHLRDLTERYNRKTPGSKRLTQEHRAHFADPRAAAGFRPEWKELVYPIATVRSKGARLWDVDGNEYIDIVNGYGPIMFGHSPEFVTRAIEEQLKLGFETGPQSALACQVAELICAMTGMERVSFCNTGSEAVVAALRVARTVTARNKVVLFSGAYHGMFDEVVVKAVAGPDGPRSLPVAPGIPREKVENVIVLDYGTEAALRYIEAHAGQLAAVLVEPVQSRHPRLQPVEFLRQVRRITEQSGTALVFDEVVTGFRAHPGGCQALFNIRADLATYGKVLAGGLPIGIVAGKAAFMDALDGGMWNYGDDSYPEAGVTFFAGTFIRHPLALAASWAVLNHLKDAGPSLQEELGARTAAMAAELNRFLEQRRVPSRVDTFSSIAYFSFPPELKFASLFYYYMRLRGVYIQEGFPIFLTTAHGDEEIARVVAAFKDSVIEMQSAGFLPGAPDHQPLNVPIVEPTAAATQAEAQASAASSAGSAPASLNGKPAAAPVREALTESQMEIWLSASLSDEHNCCYNESLTLRLSGDLDRAAFAKALDTIVTRHDALRARFSPSGEYQEFANELKLDLGGVDLSALGETERQARVSQLLADDARRPFDLLNGPLVRVSLIKLKPGEHQLLFTSHHIICDGWSTNVILDELSRLYSALRQGQPAELPRAPMSFATYARSQAAHFSGAAGQEAEQYWIDQFKQLPPPLDLPLDRPRPPIKSCAGATRRRLIPAAPYREIKRAAARQKCTLFVMLLAGFQTLLSRLSGQDDIVVGIPTAGQSALEDQILVGHCVNFLPLRGRFSGDPAMAQYLGQARQTLLDAYEHQNYTYGRLIRKLAIQRDPSRLPLLEMQFNLERVGRGMEFLGLKAEVDPNPKAFVNHDLFLNVIESDDGLVLDCDYNTRLLDAATVDRWLSHYQVLLEGAAADANQPISRLPLLAADDRRQLEQWNNTAADYPRGKGLHQLVEEQAARTPDAVAVVYEQRQLTYAELDRAANQLAAYLGKLGAGPGALVGVYLDRSLEMMIALLGVLKAGAAYVPMDPTYPVDRIMHVLEDTQAAVLLTQDQLAQNLPVAGARVVRLDTEWKTIASESSGAPPAVKMLAEDRAYVIYTSGSTGQPKGVEISHRAVVNLLCAMGKRPGLTAGDTLLAVTTLSFDIAGLELFLPLRTGAKVVIASRETAADGALLLARLASSGATVIQATPVSFRLLIEAGWQPMPTLKVLCGGEALPRDLANAILERAGSLWNMYGPTETTIWSSTLQLERGDGPVVIGRPIDNTRFHVVDARDELVPIGRPGELLIGGDGLARGYFRRPELTAERFIRDPFTTDSGARLYRTGDRVRRLPDGTFEFLGRLDNQVKLRGFRIELGEIETAVARYPGVREAVVALREDAPGDKRLVAYIRTEQQALSLTAVREFLTGKLPNYMLPSAVVRMEAMPLTANGKVDRRALPMPEAGAQRASEFVAPRTAQEQTLAAIWAEVLRLDRVGVQDNLFELGADSLHIFQIAARANKAGIRLAPAQFLKYRTIAALLEQLAKGADSAPAPALPGIVKVSRDKYRVDRSSL